jgi:hypothetical protein
MHRRRRRLSATRAGGVFSYDIMGSSTRKRARLITASQSRVRGLLRIELPIVQAPMAGSSTPEMVIAVSEAGGLGLTVERTI